MKTLAVYAAGVLTGILAAYIFVKLNYEFEEVEETKKTFEIDEKCDTKENEVEETLKEALGIKSPSKEFFEDLDFHPLYFDDEKCDTKEIFLINEDEFYNPMTYDSGKFDKVTIKYDVVDDVFFDEDGSVINDLTIFGGLDKSYAFYSCADVLYLRNEILDIDYEIIKDKSFEF